MRYNMKATVKYLTCSTCLSEVIEDEGYFLDHEFYCDMCQPEDDYEKYSSNKYAENY